MLGLKKRKPTNGEEKTLGGNGPELREISFWESWSPLFFALVLYSGIRYFVAEARYIPSGSMLPTLQINDRLLIEKISYRNRSPLRGEIVVFNSPNSFDEEIISRRLTPLPSKFKCALLNFPIINLVNTIPGFREPSCDAYIKRVVAISGDEVSVNSKGQVYIDNERIKESYVTNFCSSSDFLNSTCNPFPKVKVPQGYVLVLGDNRRNSWDGRFWPGGKFLPENEIIGRASFRFWPLNRIGNLSN